MPHPLGYNCNDFGLLFLYSSHIVHEHACARAGSHLYTRLHCCTHGPVQHRNGIFSHTQVLNTIAHTRSLNLSGNDGTHTDKHCDMHMHSIPSIKLLLCMFVQATDLMYQLCIVARIICTSIPFDNYS